MGRADAGGEDRLSAAQREVLAGAVGAAQIRDSAERWLRQTRAGITSDKVQRAIQVYFSAPDRVLRAAQVLGLERKAKPVADLASVLAQEGE